MTAAASPLEHMEGSLRELLFLQLRSLGLFRDQANAERRRAEIAALGFTPQSIARTEELPVYWLDYATDRTHPLDWRSKLGTGAAALREQAIECF